MFSAKFVSKKSNSSICEIFWLFIIMAYSICLFITAEVECS